MAAILIAGLLRQAAAAGAAALAREMGQSIAPAVIANVAEKVTAAPPQPVQAHMAQVADAIAAMPAPKSPLASKTLGALALGMAFLVGHWGWMAWDDGLSGADLSVISAEIPVLMALFGAAWGRITAKRPLK